MVDEMLVTKRTFPKSEWSNKKKNCTLDMGDMYCEPIAVIGAISREKGIESVMCFRKSVNVMKYKIFLDNLRRINPFENLILVQDNLAIHRNKHSVDRMNELSFRYAWTPRYSP